MNVPQSQLRTLIYSTLKKKTLISLGFEGHPNLYSNCKLFLCSVLESFLFYSSSILCLLHLENYVNTPREYYSFDRLPPHGFRNSFRGIGTKIICCEDWMLIVRTSNSNISQNIIFLWTQEYILFNISFNMFYSQNRHACVIIETFIPFCKMKKVQSIGFNLTHRLSEI